MTTNLHARHFLKLLDFTQKEIEHLLELAAELKWAKASGTEEAKLTGNAQAVVAMGSEIGRCLGRGQRSRVQSFLHQSRYRGALRCPPASRSESSVNTIHRKSIYDFEQ